MCIAKDVRLVGRLLRGVAILSFGLLASHPDAHATDVAAAGRSSVAGLGRGYNTTSQLFRGECVTGDVAEEGRQSAGIQTTTATSSKELSKEFGLAAGGRARFGAARVGMAAEFAAESSASDFSVALTYVHTLRFKNLVLKEPRLAPDAERARGKAAPDAPLGDAWIETCGDEFVKEVAREGKLFITVKIELATRSEKQRFAAEVTISSLTYSARAALRTAASSFSSAATLEIHAFQLGGDNSKLSTIFAGAPGARNATVRCSMAEPDACLNVIDAAVSYAAGDFARQLAAKGGPADMTYVTAPYTTLGYRVKSIAATKAAIAFQNELSDRLDRQIQIRARASALLNGKIRLEKSQESAVREAYGRAERNVTEIIRAAEACYDDATQCAGLNVVPIDESVLEVVPRTIAQFCDLAELPSTDPATTKTMRSLVAFGRHRFNNWEHLDDRCGALEGALALEDSVTLRPPPCRRPSGGAPAPDYACMASFDLRPVALLRGVKRLHVRAPIDRRFAALPPSLTQLVIGPDDDDDSPHNKLPAMPGIVVPGAEKVPIRWLENLDFLRSAPGLASLEIRDAGIGDLAALSGAASLKTLVLARAGVADITPLASLRALSRLSLADNWVTDVRPLAGLTNLTVLDLQGNKIRSLLPLAGLSALEALNVSGAPNADLSLLQRLAGLRVLVAAGSGITSVASLRGLGSLTALDLHDNRITDASPLAGMTQLEQLDISGNQVRDLSFVRGLASLAALGAAGNAISDLRPLGSLVNLERLDLSANEIVDTRALTPLARLEQLCLAGNKIVDAGPLGALAGLRHLSVFKNGIRDARPLGALPNLQSLNVAQNPLVDSKCPSPRGVCGVEAFGVCRWNPRVAPFQ